MKTNFFKTEKKEVNINIPFTEMEFINILNEQKPKNIINPMYSSKKPCWVIREYLENNIVKYFADGWADKTPQYRSMRDLYNEFNIQGLASCYFENDLK
jgi:hypothetical protein